jgi:hypothetical protein
MPDDNNIPADYAQWARQYFGEVIAAVREAVAAPAASPQVAPIWSAAAAAAEAHLKALKKKLRNADHPDLAKVARVGMDEIEGKLKGRLPAALAKLDAGAGPAREGAAKAVRSLVSEYVGYLQGDHLLKMLDANPFEVRVTLRLTLGKALGEISKTVRA